MSDPDHLPSFSIDALYAHWLGQQKKSLSPFIILNASPLHSAASKISKKDKGKQKQEYYDVGSSDEDHLVEKGKEGNGGAELMMMMRVRKRRMIAGLRETLT